MRVQEPSNADISRWNFDKQEHNAKHDREVHEYKRANKSYESDDMVTNHLLVQGRKSACDYTKAKCVEYEIATGVDKGPNVQIARRVKTFLVIEDSLPISADGEHGEQWEYHCSYGMHRCDNVCAILGLLNSLQFVVALVQSSVDSVQ